ncbi:hypothetical protein ACHAXA_009709 [Cyclostephanos tholiformis]|uniref:Uncharacterized protein n=1 Tax=Cyclostephanos tholiformis TaxID=382380 RepID=A0ABD3RV42_9STRA
MELFLSPFLATLSYLPFQVVAKVTILICVLLFVVDPYPGSRLISLLAVCCVNLIHRANVNGGGRRGEAGATDDD